jgi:hypothetical protein
VNENHSHYRVELDKGNAKNDKARPSVITRDTCSIGDTIACFPSAHVVELVEKQIVQQWAKLLGDEE